MTRECGRRRPASESQPTSRKHCMNNVAEWDACKPACRDALKQLLTRHSVGPKHLVLPAPTEEQVWLAIGAALRAPDHQKLLPFRFVVIPDDSRPLLGELFADFARRRD